MIYPSRSKSDHVLVVATTTDYIRTISQRWPSRVVFLTDAAERANQPLPDNVTELTCDLSHPRLTVSAVRRQLDHWQIQPAGVACYDCESLPLAATIARALDLPFASPRGVRASRSKFISKQLWQAAGVACPAVGLVQTAEEAIAFMKELGKAVILKPLTGSGSELVFKCEDEDELRPAFETLARGMAGHPRDRLYTPQYWQHQMIDPRTTFAVEQFISGTEYSCDFVLDGGRVRILRTARKIPHPDGPIGTTVAYVTPADFPAAFDVSALERQLKVASTSLGIARCMAMVDFIIEEGRAMLIELTPRPGGDCLPPLVLKASGFDVIGASLDFASQLMIEYPRPDQWERHVGLRLFAGEAGMVRAIDVSGIEADGRVVEVQLNRGAGHRVVLPPEDYGSRILGHVIFRPVAGVSIERQCEEISRKLQVTMESVPCAMLIGS